MAAKKPMDKAGLLEYDDRPIEGFTPPGWPRPLLLRAPPLGAVLQLTQTSQREGATAEEIQAATDAFMVQGIVDERGGPLLSLEEYRQFIDARRPAVGRAITQRIQELTGMLDRDPPADGSSGN